jgi:Holliday junction resolvasome RuvABC endonuclease subunit
MKILSLDLSLRSTGWCCSQPGPEDRSADFGTFEGCPLGGMDRLHWLIGQIAEYARHADLVVIEDIAFGYGNAGSAELIGLAYLVRYRIWRLEKSVLLVAPTRLKKFVCGSGQAAKSMILREVYRRFGQVAANDNEADAIGLNYLGQAVCGLWEPQTKAQREVVGAVYNASEGLIRAAIEAARIGAAR